MMVWPPAKAGLGDQGSGSERVYGIAETDEKRSGQYPP
jgi:hypothetical protein